MELDEYINLGTFAYYTPLKEEIHFPINSWFEDVDEEERAKEIQYSTLWHEFQHFLYDRIIRPKLLRTVETEFVRKIEGIAERMYNLALDGNITEYAKKSENEALSEAFRMIYLRRDNVDERMIKFMREYYNLLLDYIRERW